MPMTTISTPHHAAGRPVRTASGQRRCTNAPAAARTCHCQRHPHAPQATAAHAPRWRHGLYPLLDQINAAFQTACTRAGDPHTPTAAGPIPLRDLYPYLTCPITAQAERDRIWSGLLDQIRGGDGRDDELAVLAALAFATPRLIQLARRAAPAANPADPGEVIAETLAAFTAAVRTAPITPYSEIGAGTEVFYQLTRPAQAAAQRTARTAWAATRHTIPAVEIDRPEPDPNQGATAGHPDLALARLVADQVITRDEADHLATGGRSEDHPAPDLRRTRLVPHAGHPRPARSRNESHPRPRARPQPSAAQGPPRSVTNRSEEISRPPGPHCYSGPTR